jgi:hypothetical protein
MSERVDEALGHGADKSSRERSPKGAATERQEPYLHGGVTESGIGSLKAVQLKQHIVLKRSYATSDVRYATSDKRHAICDIRQATSDKR